MKYGEFPLFLDIKNSLIDIIWYSGLEKRQKAVILGSDGQVGLYSHAFNLFKKKKQGINGSYELGVLVEGMKEYFKDDVLLDICERYLEEESAGGRILTLEEPELVPKAV